MVVDSEEPEAHEAHNLRMQATAGALREPDSRRSACTRRA